MNTKRRAQSIRATATALAASIVGFLFAITGGGMAAFLVALAFAAAISAWQDYPLPGHTRRRTALMGALAAGVVVGLAGAALGIRGLPLLVVSGGATVALLPVFGRWLSLPTDRPETTSQIVRRWPADDAIWVGPELRSGSTIPPGAHRLVQANASTWRGSSYFRRVTLSDLVVGHEENTAPEVIEQSLAPR